MQLTSAFWLQQKALLVHCDLTNALTAASAEADGLALYPLLLANTQAYLH